MSQVLTSPAATVCHIPKKARPFYAEVIAVTDAWALQSNDPSVWALRAGRAKLCLRVPPRRGPDHSSNSGIQPLILSRCKQLLSGDIDTLWDSFLSDTAKRHTKTPRRLSDEDQLEQNARRARTLASEGDLSRAVTTLTSRGMADNSAAVFQQLSDKHPAGTPPPPVVNHTPPLQVSPHSPPVLALQANGKPPASCNPVPKHHCCTTSPALHHPHSQQVLGR